jgi:hypothetical protein
MHPLLEIGAGGISVIRFVDIAAPQRPKEWDLTFDKNGKLLTVANSTVAVPKVNLLPQ